jgi:hypothetical protein
VLAVRGRKKNPLDGSNSKIVDSEGSIPAKHILFKIKFENVNKMKNKSDPALLQTSNSITNEIKK